MFISSGPIESLLVQSHVHLNARCQSYHPCLLTAHGTLFTRSFTTIFKTPPPPCGDITHQSYLAPLHFHPSVLAGMHFPSLLAQIQAFMPISHPPFPLQLICSTLNRGNCFHLNSCNILSLTALYLFCFTIASFVFEYLS